MTLAAIFSWLRSLPQWLWLVLLAMLGFAMMQRRAYSEGKDDATQTITDEIEEATNDATTRAEKAEREARGPDRSSDDLNAAQLRRLQQRTENHPLISRPDLSKMGD